MQIQVNSDKNIKVDERVASFVRNEADRALSPFKRRLTRVEFHLSDVNSHKFAALDKRCKVEARPAGRKPLGVTMTAGTVRSAVQGSLAKLQSALEKYFGRLTRTSRGPKVTAALKRSAATAAQPAKRAAARKKTAAAKSGSTAAASTARAPKKKMIYQARRKSWPMRQAA